MTGGESLPWPLSRDSLINVSWIRLCLPPPRSTFPDTPLRLMRLAGLVADVPTVLHVVSLLPPPGLMALPIALPMRLLYTACRLLLAARSRATRARSASGGNQIVLTPVAAVWLRIFGRLLTRSPSEANAHNDRNNFIAGLMGRRTHAGLCH